MDYFIPKTIFEFIYLICPYLATNYFFTKCYYSIISKLLVTKNFVAKDLLFVV